MAAVGSCITLNTLGTRLTESTGLPGFVFAWLFLCSRRTPVDPLIRVLLNSNYS